MTRPTASLSVKLEPELEARVVAEAAALGKPSKSAHARDIIRDHFAGQGSEAVVSQLGDLAAEVAHLREALGARTSPDVSEVVLAELRDLRALVKDLAAAVHYTSGAYMTQLNLPDRGKYLERFERLRAKYRGEPQD